ncbi:MAG: hypothetical protein ABW136_01025 [Steroidobacteraceae bacterium]
MTTFAIAFALVVVLLVGSLMALRHYRLGMPSQDVIDRAKQREREIEARERAEADD